MGKLTKWEKLVATRKALAGIQSRARTLMPMSNLPEGYNLGVTITSMSCVSSEEERDAMQALVREMRIQMPEVVASALYRLNKQVDEAEKDALEEAKRLVSRLTSK